MQFFCLKSFHVELKPQRITYFTEGGEPKDNLPGSRDGGDVEGAADNTEDMNTEALIQAEKVEESVFDQIVDDMKGFENEGNTEEEDEGEQDEKDTENEGEAAEKLDKETKAILLENFIKFTEEMIKVIANNPKHPLSQWIKFSGFNIESEAGKEAVHAGLDAFINDLTEEELANIKADPESFSFEGQESRIGTLILRGEGLSEEEIERMQTDPENAQEVLLNFLKQRRLEHQANNPNERPLTQEAALATLQNPQDTEGLQALAKRLGEFFSFFMEFYEKGDYAGMIDVFEVGIMEEGDPVEVQKQSKQDYIDTLKNQDLDVSILISIVVDARGRDADATFGPNKRFRKGAEEAAQSALSEKLGITINKVTQEGEETIIEYNSKYKASLTQSETKGTQLIVSEYSEGAYKNINLQEPEIMNMETGEVVPNLEDTDGDPTTANLPEGGDLTEFLRRHLKK